MVNVIPIVEEESEDEPYNPTKPNNYEEYSRKLLLKRQRKKNFIQANQENIQKAQLQGRLHAQQQEAIERAKELQHKMKTNSEKNKKSNIGLKMLQKMGYKKGEGLGKFNEGVKGFLVPGKNNTPTVSMDISRILRLQNMVGRGKIDSDLLTDTGQECSRFGQVLNVIIHETKNQEILDEHAVSVFVEFLNPFMAEVAINSFHGRFFGGRKVYASFFPEERYLAKDLDPS